MKINEESKYKENKHNVFNTLLLCPLGKQVKAEGNVGGCGVRS
jgi:hypothetical protein